MENIDFTYSGELPKDLNYLYYSGDCLIEITDDQIEKWRDIFKRINADIDKIKIQ